MVPQPKRISSTIQNRELQKNNAHLHNKHGIAEV
jgi:hypothetical protein